MRSRMKKHITFDRSGAVISVEPIPDGVDPAEFMRQQMDDCPLCREARARGEEPIIMQPDTPPDANETRQARRHRARQEIKSRKRRG